MTQFILIMTIFINGATDSRAIDVFPDIHTCQREGQVMQKEAPTEVGAVYFCIAKNSN